MNADAIAEVLVGRDELAAKIEELAARISRDYEGEEILLVGVLKGAVFFMADLARRIDGAGGSRLHGRVELRVVHRLVGRGAHPQGP